MLHILLLILKILGILLLVILGVILAVVLLVLFVPVRYRGDVSFYGKPEGGVMVSWLLHLVTVRVNYDGSVKALVKVLCFKLFDKTVWPAEEDEAVAEEALEEIAKPEEVKQTVSAPAESAPKAETSVQTVETESKPKAEKMVETEDKPKNDKKAKAEAPKPVETPKTADTQAEIPEKSLIEKVTEKICDILDKLSGAYERDDEKIKTVQTKIEKVRAFLADAENQNTLKLLLGQVFKLIKHILPREIRGRVRFGFEDPYTTGQVLTYISPFYGLYANTVEIEPVFDEKVMEGELHLKGHIRLGALLWIVVRVFLNKNFRKLLKSWSSKGK